MTSNLCRIRLPGRLAFGFSPRVILPGRAPVTLLNRACHRPVRLDATRPAQMRLARGVESARWIALASLRADQCVAPGGFSLSVMATTRSIVAASSGLRPGRGAWAQAASDAQLQALQ